ncbi:MAG: PAS domain-containing protein [Geminicoccaceae bacterium]
MPWPSAAAPCGGCAKPATVGCWPNSTGRWPSVLTAANRILTAITDHAAELVGLKDAAGCYRFVNPTFARHLAMPAAAVTGRTDQELFPAAVAEALAANAEDAAAGGAAPSLEIETGDPARPLLLEVTQAPVLAEGGRIEGTVLIGRDVTERAAARRLREELAGQTCHAFMRAIGTVDPYLVGHAEAVREVALAIGEALGLSDR